MNSFKSSFLKTFCLVAGAALQFSAVACAQSIAKIDLISAYNEVPSPPVSVSDALSKSTCIQGNCKADALFKSFESTFAEAQKEWAVMNAGQKARLDSAKQLAGIMQPVAGNNTTNTQKLEAAKQIPGANMATMNFAQQMQDPTFKAKFAGMSQEQKLA